MPESLKKPYSLNEDIYTSISELTRRISVQSDYAATVVSWLRNGDCSRSSFELSSVKAFLQDGKSQLDELCNDNIDRIEGAVRELKKARDTLRYSVDVTASLLSPIRRLPQDILVSIFSILIAEEGYSLVLGKGICTTLRLSQICSFWRNIISSRPILWSTISLRKKKRMKHCKIQHSQILPYYILRSADAPLTLNLQSSFHRQPELDLLLAHSRRWREVLLGDPALDYISFKLSQSTIFSSLTTVRFHFRHVQVTWFSNWRAPTFSADSFHNVLTYLGPKVTTFHGAKISLSWENFCQYNFLNMKEVKYVGLGGEPGSLAQFFARMPELELCHLTSFTVNDGHVRNGIQFGEGYHHSNLTTLYVEINDFSLGSGWEKLYLPRLTSLLLCSPTGACLVRLKDRRSKLLLEISDMLLHSKSSLQSLKLCDVSAQDAIDFIGSHPSIEALTICACYDKDSYPETLEDLLSRLTISSDSGQQSVIAPNMTRLSLDLHAQGSIADMLTILSDDICNLVEHRAAANLDPSLQISHLQMVELCAALPIRTRETKKLRSNAYKRMRSCLAPLRDSGRLSTLTLR